MRLIPSVDRTFPISVVFWVCPLDLRVIRTHPVACPTFLGCPAMSIVTSDMFISKLQRLRKVGHGGQAVSISAFDTHGRAGFVLRLAVP